MSTEIGALAVDDTLPERRETLRVDRRFAVLNLLVAVREQVERTPLGRVRREKLGKLESLHAAVRRWELCPPQPEQLSAVLDLLVNLHTARSRTDE